MQPNETQLEEVFQIVLPEVQRLVARGRIHRRDAPDFEQDLLLEVMKERHRYDSARGAWGAFVAWVVRTRAASVLRYRRRRKRLWLYQRIDAAVDLPDGAPSSFLLVELRIDLALALETLSPADLRLCEEIAQNGSPVRTAWSRRKLDAARRRVADRFRKFGLDPTSN